MLFSSVQYGHQSHLFTRVHLSVRVCLCVCACNMSQLSQQQRVWTHRGLSCLSDTHKTHLQHLHGCHGHMTETQTVRSPFQWV